MNDNPTATLWILAYQGITPATHAAIVAELADWPTLRHSIMPGDALVDRARSRAVTNFLKTAREDAGDVLLFVDADISCQPGDLSHIARRALEHNAIVGGIYSKRFFGQGSAVRFGPPQADDGEYTIGTDNLIPVEYVSTGFMAIPRSAALEVAKTMPYTDQGFWPLFMPMVKGSEYLSEDWSFCERARAAGFNIHAACLPRLTHEGSYSYRLVDAKSRPYPDELVTIKLHSSSDALASERR